MAEAEKPKMVMVPAELLTRATQLLGKLPAEHSAHVYVALLECKTEDARSERANP
jgi:hypothetical protein